MLPSAELGTLQLGCAAAAALGAPAVDDAAHAQRDAGGAGANNRQETGVYHWRCLSVTGRAERAPDRPGNG
jgi:hypothetical protein